MASLVYYVIGGTPSTLVLFVFLSFLIVHHGIELVNQAHDYLEDKETGLLTPSVRWGITNTLIVAFLLTIVGLGLGFVVFYFLFYNLPNVVILGYSVSYEILFIITVVILILAYLTPLKGNWKFISISLQNKTVNQKISLMKKQLNYPKWQLTGVLGVTFISTLFLVWKLV
jgi:4-hydroxybenzoate polyprenyltransferase